MHQTDCTCERCYLGGAPICRKCGGAMKPGKAMWQTFIGAPDFPGDKGTELGCTISPGGPGKLIDCMKCEQCGWSLVGGGAPAGPTEDERSTARATAIAANAAAGIHLGGAPAGAPTEPGAMWDRFVAAYQEDGGYNRVVNLLGNVAKFRAKFIEANERAAGAPCEQTEAGCAPDCHNGNRCAGAAGAPAVPHGPSPEHILRLLDVVDKARIAMESDDGDAMAFFKKLVDLRDALQALDASAIRDLEKDRTAE